MNRYLILIKILFNRYKYKLIFGKKSQIRNIYIEVFFTLDVSIKSLGKVIVKSVNFRKYNSIRIRNKGILNIGSDVFLNSFCSNCLESIIIGDNYILGENVKFYNHNFSTRTIPFREKDFLQNLLL